MAKRKKICMFAGEVILDFQKEVCTELMEQTRTRDLDVVLFASYGSYNGPHGRNMFFEMGEKNIINLPVFSEYDAIIICPDTFDINGMAEELYEKIRNEANCPVVCLRDGPEDFPVITVNNYGATKAITNHFIKDHGFERICYMSGPLDAKDGAARYKGFCDAMSEAGIPFMKNTLFEGDYWKSRTKAAVDHFLDCPNDQMPQVIICANDYMGVSVIEELTRRGIRVPEDICVCGFDDVPESRTSAPPMTTISTVPTEFATLALDILEKLWNGEEVDSVNYIGYKLELRESCGCGVFNGGVDYNEIVRRLTSVERLLRETSRISTEYQTNFTMENIYNVANFHFYILDCAVGYLCVCDESEPEILSLDIANAYSNNMILKAIMYKNKNFAPNYCNVKFKRAKVLPSEIFDNEYPSFQIVFQIHFRSKAYGYLVVVPKSGEWPNLYMVMYLDTLAYAIESSIMEEEFIELSEIKKQYLIDPLTNVYNRRGFEKSVQTLLSKDAKTSNNYYVSIVSIDLDNLKTINDVYGHQEGDVAIIEIADCIKSCLGVDDFVARIGGDEFIAIIVSNAMNKRTDFKERLEKKIEEKSNALNKPYKLHASVGLCEPKKISEFDLIKCMQIADERMYENKRAYKKSLQ